MWESRQTPSLYKVQSPYVRPFPVSGANVETQDLELTVDASDPEMVYLPAQYSGFDMNPNFGTLNCINGSKVYIANSAGTYYDQVVAGQMTNDQVRSALQASARPVDVVKDGEIVFNLPLYGSDPMADINNVWEQGPGRLVLPVGEPQTDERTWTPIGKGKLYDGWITAGFCTMGETGFDPVSTPFEVDMEECDDQPGVYRMVSPWSAEGFPFVDRNLLRGEEAYIEINASDPEYVVVMPQFSGFATTLNAADLTFYVANLAGFYFDSFKWEKDMYNSFGYEPDTFEDGVIWFNYPTTANAINQCMNCYPNLDGKPGFCTAEIELPNVGIANVDATADAPVAYYDLQGRRVLNPQGGVFIRQQGASARKVLR